MHSTPARNGMGMKQFVSNHWEKVFFICLVAFSSWLMFRSFSYNFEGAEILLSHNIWSDFGANLPLIRSFSFGENWPPEYPIFPGEPIRYHFLFFLIVGFLEKIGVPIHFALNVPSLIGFSAILIFAYKIAKQLFDDTRVAVLSVVFIILNGSLGFLQFFEKHPLNWNSLADIWQTTGYTAMGPWDGGNVLGFWHLNVFINQRHFAVALGFLMYFIWFCLKRQQSLAGRGSGNISSEQKSIKRAPLSIFTRQFWNTFISFDHFRSDIVTGILFGVAVGLLVLFHKPVMLIFAVVITAFFSSFRSLRLFLISVGGVALVITALVWLSGLSITPKAGSAVEWFPGFAIHENLDLKSVANFFWWQWGLHTVLIPIGFLLAPRRVKLVMLPVFAVFLIAFLFKFSLGVLANHKFINFFLFMAQMLSAFVFIKGIDWSKQKSAGIASRIAAGGIGAAIVLFMTLSGIIDLAAIKNYPMTRIKDIQSDPKAKWFIDNTPPDAVVLNSSYFYHPASIAGRKIFFGWGYFTLTAGYEVGVRESIMKKMYSGGDKRQMCSLLKTNNISYLTAEDTHGSDQLPPVNFEYFNTELTPDYVSPDGKLLIFETANLCDNSM